MKARIRVSIVGMAAAAACIAGLATSAGGQSIVGSSIPFRSSGSGAGNWTLTENGYVGTYFTLDEPGPVTFTVNAAGSSNDATLPRMNVVVADFKAGFDVGGGFNDYQHTFDLPAGTYFVRTEFANDVPTANRQLTIGSLSVAGATSVSTTPNTSGNRTTNDAYALAAADTYIEHFRQGPARVALVGVSPGSSVDVRMVRRDFKTGTMVQGFDADVFLAPVSPGDTTSVAARYQNFVRQYFDIVVPSNMGKWAHTEPEPGELTMGNVDTILNYAQNNKLNVRMHNLIWGTQQPAFVNDLISQAQNPNPAISEPAKANLMQAIVNRIAYYVGDGDGDTNDGDRSQRYQEIDVLNEALRDGTYWDIFGAEGVAQIHKLVKDAVEAAGASTRLYTNEYNIFQFANNPDGSGADPYANWYRRNVEEINNAGYGEVVTGIGIQSIADPRTNLSFNDIHSPSRINQVMHNLSVTGLPITLTEFSVPSPFGFTVTPELSAQIYGESLRMLFGSPQATSFLIWEAWPSPSATPDGVTTIVDNNWNLTPSGQVLVDLIDSWTTRIDDLVVGPDGTIDFTGFYGDYEIVIDGVPYELALTKGNSLYSLVVRPGDYNGDGRVDGGDYVTWRNALGSDDDLRADGNGNGMVDLGDYDEWKAAYGTIYDAGSGQLAGNVPESATVISAWCVLAAAALGRDFRRRRGSRTRRSRPAPSTAGRCP